MRSILGLKGPGHLLPFRSLVFLQPGGCAAVSLVFAEYMCRVLYHTAFSASPAESVEAIPQVVIKLVAITAVALVSTLNMISTRVGTLATTTFTVVKVLALCMVMVVGIVQATRHEASESLKQPLFENASTSPSSYAIALYSGCWAFAGWDQLCYVAGDLHAPTKNLPRVIHASMGIVLTLYLIANLSYFVVLPLQDIAHSNTVALDFGKAVLGPAGGLIFALLVACSCFGNLNGVSLPDRKIASHLLLTHSFLKATCTPVQDWSLRPALRDSCQDSFQSFTVREGHLFTPSLVSSFLVTHPLPMLTRSVGDRPCRARLPACSCWLETSSGSSSLAPSVLIFGI